MYKIKFSNKRLKQILVCISFIIIPIIAYSDAIFSQQIMVTGDGITTLVAKEFLKMGILQGDIPIWNRFLEIGIPYVGNIQNAFFYPLHILLLLFNTETFTNLFYTLHLSFAGMFMYMYLNQLQKNQIISFVTGIIFMFSSIIGGVRKEHINIVSTIIWLPLILYFLEKFRQNKEIKYIIFSALIMSIQFFAGFPQMTLYANIVIFFYLIHILFEAKYSYKNVFKIILGWILLYIALISIQALPLIEQMLFSGRNEVPYEFFSVLSYDYKILPMMFFPQLYWDIYEPFGSYASSGIDIEIYFGIICLMYTTFGLKYIKEEKKLKLFYIILLITFIFGASANIPILGRIIWKIPIIGSFRVISRVMFIVIFFCIVIFAISIYKIENKNDWKYFLKFNLVFLIILIIARLGIDSLIYAEILNKEIFSELNIRDFSYWIPIILVSINLFLIIVFNKLRTKGRNKKFAFNIICIMVGVITIIDVGRFSIKHQLYSIEDVLGNTYNYDKDVFKENDQRLYRGWGGIIDSKTYTDEKFKLGKLNRNMISNTMLINSYTTFNDPRLSEVLGRDIYSDFVQLITDRNDIISMLSIKYIYDPWGNINPKNLYSSEVEEVVQEIDNIIIESQSEELVVKIHRIPVQKGHNYKIEFDMRIKELPDLFYIDLYSSNYDNAEQDVLFNLEEGYNHYSAIVNTGSKELPQDIYLRVIAKTSNDMVLENIKITRLKNIEFAEVYKDMEDDLIYENINAQPILYIPERIISIVDEGKVLKDNLYTQLNKINYIQDFRDIDLTNVKTEIKNIEVSNNKVSATIKSDKDTFVNHTQSNYPSWKAYIDGEEVPIYLVNEIIQGIEVPKGIHEIEFIFKPRSMLIGGIISLIGVGVIIIVLINERKKFLK